ncbi:hypothetical protein HTG_12820 [Natrinema mahii]|nr:hypothetical protein HTG_12820 [Natrinema mahii]
MLNGSDKSHTFIVTVSNESGEEIFGEVYDLEPLTGDENQIIEGTPAEFSVAIDDNKPEVFHWDPQVGTDPHSDECSEGTSTSLTIYYNMQEGEGLKPSYGCETVTD